ncbi:MAG: GntR family transcriptional regulator [Bacillota bacterium]
MLRQGSAKYVTKADLVHSVLRENIITGNLKPGTRLLLKDIAAELGVSEIPVREALRRLQAEGLVTINPHCGAEVTKPNSAEYREILTIRAVLEGFAARTAVQNMTASDIEDLRLIVEAMRDCVEKGDMEAYGGLNRQFHCSIYKFSGLRKLQELITDLWDRWGRSQSVFQLNPGRISESLEEHAAILRAIEARDENNVELLMREHRLRAAEALIKALEGGVP